MAKGKTIPLSPTVVKILDKFHSTLRSDESIDNASVDRLDALLRKGNVPKPDEIDVALFPPTKGDKL